MNMEIYLNAIDQADTYKRYGKVLQVIGLMIESQGPAANIGEVCYIHTTNSNESPILAEVVGFNKEKIILMPYTELTEIGPGCLVEATGKPLTIKMGTGLIGKVIDPLGHRLDQSELPSGLRDYLTERPPPNPMTRQRIFEPFQVGIKAIDAMLTVGRSEERRVGKALRCGWRSDEGA